MVEKHDVGNSIIQTGGTLRIRALDEFEAKLVLQRLIARGGSISEAVQEQIENLISTIDMEFIASQVYSNLDGIQVEDLWDRSGSSRYGYTDPSDESWVMIEEVLTPYLERIREYQDAGMASQAQQYCLGVLEGIVIYSEQSDSEFKNWAPDDPETAFSWIYSEWKGGAENDPDAKEFQRTVREKFPEWSV